MNQPGPGLAHQLGRTRAGMRPLDGQHGKLGALSDLDGEAGRLGLHPGQILVAGAGIDHQAITPVG